MRLAVLLICISTAGCSGSNTQASQDMSRPTWEYGGATDKMRGTTSNWATLASTNMPYLTNIRGEPTPAKLVIKKDADATIENAALAIMIDHGQIDCQPSSYPPACFISMKADNAPVAVVGGEQGPCEPTSCIYLFENPSTKQLLSQGFEAKSAVPRFLKAKHVTIEIPLLGYGKFQYEFDLQGFDRSKLVAGR